MTDPLSPYRPGQTPVTSQSVIADDGAEISVRVGGQGPPMLLLHEWASSHRIWEPFAHHLEDRFTIYRWDARGHGTSCHNSPGGAMTLARMSEDLANLLTFFDLDNVCVVGHSMGALIIWSYIRKHGCERIGRLCFIDQSPRLTTDASAWAFTANWVSPSLTFGEMVA